MIKVIVLIVSLFIVVQCSTTPGPEATEPSSKSPVVVQGSSTDSSVPTTRGPHTHDEHPPNDPDHSDHPGHEDSLENPKEELKHHQDGHVHDHDHDHVKEDNKTEDETKPVEESKDAHEKGIRREPLIRRFG